MIPTETARPNGARDLGLQDPDAACANRINLGTKIP